MVLSTLNGIIVGRIVELDKLHIRTVFGNFSPCMFMSDHSLGLNGCRESIKIDLQPNRKALWRGLSQTGWCRDEGFRSGCQLIQAR